MTWDEVIVYVLGCAALEQSRDIAVTPFRKRIPLQVHGTACINVARTAADLKSFGEQFARRFSC
jgi:hypothetical protein